ncbi:ACT domain-containing protein [Cognatishimia sp. 1_MG-2023]|uniref:ACT domain-containing protein n=1 Tax=Cognatishimia sp. 1_MG-2023 TaxID=3062642 RepID=UPI0026E3FD5E|nr:ACT domain-containing protein [Cognatishimia sp. 1_MG-2023]MDO6728244.1 ACT domain-containing protein [Cognatishimia sp. 1_MG-2023]
MAGEKNLDILLSSMTGALVDGVYVFATLKDQSLPSDIRPRMMFEEAEGTTYILLKEDADAAGISYEFPSRMITLEIHSSLDAVGFMARIATDLAKENMGVNPVSAFFHDHIFIPDGREDDALRVLKEIAASVSAQV